LKTQNPLDSCEIVDACLNPIAFIVDCDKCKNIFVCKKHVGLVLNNHAKTCNETLYVDIIKDITRYCQGERQMPITIQTLPDDQLAAVFGRRPRGAEDVEDYIDVLEHQKMAIGKGFALKTIVVKAEDGEPYVILDGSIDEADPAGVTTRAAKRRFNLAAKALGYKLIWREPEGWLAAKAVELDADIEENGQAPA
jgi:hypothetical protein